MNRTLARLGRKEARADQGTTLSKKSIKSIVKAAMSPLNESIVRNREAIDQIRNLPRTVSLLESQVSNFLSQPYRLFLVGILLGNTLRFIFFLNLLHRLEVIKVILTRITSSFTYFDSEIPCKVFFESLNSLTYQFHD